MKSTVVLSVLFLLLSSCASFPRPEDETVTISNDITTSRYSIVDPREYPVIIKETDGGPKKIFFSKLTNQEINDLLPLENSIVTIQKITAEGSIGFTSAKFTAEAGRYKVLLDYMKFRDETLQDSGQACRLGIGIRITADVITKKANLDLGSIYAIGLAAKTGNISGQIEVLKIGIDSSKISFLMPPPMEINDSSLQNILQAAAAIRAKLYDTDTKLTPHILAVKEESAGKNKIVLNSYFSDLDGKKEYLSCNGTIEYIKDRKDNSLKGSTTVNDLSVNGKVQQHTWKVTGYKRDNYLYLSYGTGVAVLKYLNDDYVGYWIGENSEGALMKCPYVLSKDRLTDNEAKERWNVFGQNCNLWNITDNKFIKPN